MDNSIGSFIAYLRKEKNLTQSELAKKLNVTDKAISRWENNINFPDIDTIMKLCVIFDVTLEEMYSGKRIDNIKVRRKKKIKKILFMFFILLFILCFSFLLIYFFNNYNTIKFYKLYVDDQQYELNNSYIMTYKNNIIFNFGGFEYLNDLDTSNIYIEIYVDKEDTILYSGIYKSVYVETTGIINVDNLYIKIFSFNNEDIEILKIDSLLRYSNKKMFVFNNRINDNSISNDSNELIDLLDEYNYSKKSDNIFYKKDNNSSVYINILSNVYNKVIIDNNKKEIITFYPNLNYLDYQLFNINSKSNNVVLEFYYFIEKDSYSCVIGRCNNYDDIINSLNDDLKIIRLMNKINNG